MVLVCGIHSVNVVCEYGLHICMCSVSMLCGCVMSELRWVHVCVCVCAHECVCVCVYA